MFKFKKIASILASTVMLTSTMALAAAASYPEPFVKGGTSNVAIVYGGPGIALTDVVAASDIKSSLVDTLLSQRTTTTTTTAIKGEATPLFTGGTKLYINDTLNAVRTTLTKTELPTVLADNTFSGNADSKYTQTIDIGVYPILTFTKQPTTSDEPVFGYALSQLTANYLYNSTINFNKETNFTHTSSKGQEIKLFGQKFTVSSSTDNTYLVLFKDAQTLNFDSTGTTSSEVTIAGKKYTVELVNVNSASTATVKVTKEDGTSEQKDIALSSSKKIAGLSLAVTSASGSTQKYTASLIAGSEKYTFTTGSAVTKGDDDTVIDGTKVTFSGYSSTPASLSKIVISTTAKDSDHDALTQSQIFKDPVFGSFKMEFNNMNIGQNDTSKRESILIDSATDKVQVRLTDARKNEKTIIWAKNTTSGRWLQSGDEGQNITVFEMQSATKNDYIVVGNEENGRLVKVYQILNQTSGYSTDKVQFQDVFSSDMYDTTINGEGTGSVVIGGKTYTVTYYGSQGAAINNVTLGYPDSSGTASAILYPTIQTSMGGKFAFYKPVTINASNWDSSTGLGNNLTQLKFPNGNGYSDITVAPSVAVGGNVSVNSVGLGTIVNTTGFAVGRLRYNATYVGTSMGSNTFTINLINPADGSRITDPALILIEEKDDNANYEALIVTVRESSAKLGVSDVIRTWMATTTSGTGNFRESMASESKKIQQADLFGTVTTIDQISADQYKATISYPDEQVFASVYVAEDSASFDTSGGSSGGTGEAGNVVLVVDSEVASVSGKNLIVVGGSCINKVAADLLGSSTPKCGDAFTTATGISSGQFLIQTFERTGGTVATLVAGYNADDTENAATYLRTQKAVLTDKSKKYKGTSSTSAELVVASGNASGNQS